MDDKLLKLEALVYAAGRPVDIDEAAALLKLKRDAASELANALVKTYDDRGGALICVRIDDSIQIRVRDDFFDVASAIKRPELDKDVLKSASLIGYYQPLLQSDLVSMVGDRGYAHVAFLLELGLITKDKDSRSFKLATTPKFAQHFGLKRTDAEGIRQELARRLGLTKEEMKKDPLPKEG